MKRKVGDTEWVDCDYSHCDTIVSIEDAKLEDWDLLVGPGRPDGFYYGCTPTCTTSLWRELFT